MIARFFWVAALIATPVYAKDFKEMGIPPGYYTYQGECSKTFAGKGKLGAMSFVFDGENLNSAQSRCKIKAVDFISAGYLNAITKCVDNKTGRRTNESYTLLPDQSGKPRIKLEAIYVNGKLTSRGNPGWFHLCKGIKPKS